jgi:PIN domain nuclease of toxin-antitoxin system
MSRIDALQISTGEAGPALTPQHKRFNTLIRQIGQARQTLASWLDGIDDYRQAHAKVLLPLQAELTAARRQWVFALDELLDQRGWTKAQRNTLGEMVCETAGELLHAGGDDDAALKALFAKHAEVDFDTERQEMALAMKAMTEAVTGLDLGDDEGIATQDDLLKRMQQELKQQAAAEQAEQAERDAKLARRRKSAAQQRREAEAQQATQSLREIYRKLASALHPDRETDEQQRQVKTALMQKVNQAYAADDLLTLLELQLQIEQIDADHMANTSVERLKHYNKVLGEQLAQLREQIQSVDLGFRIEFGLPAGWGLNPRQLDQVLEQNSRDLHAELSRQQHDLRMLADPAATKRWLKRQGQLQREAPYDFGLF